MGIGFLFKKCQTTQEGDIFQLKWKEISLLFVSLLRKNLSFTFIFKQFMDIVALAPYKI